MNLNAATIFFDWQQSTPIVRSAAYQKGVMSALHRFVSDSQDKALNSPYRAGTSNSDAFYSGFRKGMFLAGVKK